MKPKWDNRSRIPQELGIRTAYHGDQADQGPAWDGMEPVDIDGLPALRFPALGSVPGVVHGIFTRHGGVSPAPFHSFNLAEGVGDAAENVRENRRRLQRALGGGHLVALRQVHGTTVVAVDGQGPGSEAGAIRLEAGEGDALITRGAGLWLTILVADCQAVFLVDPHRMAVANIHAGWRGSVGDIVGKTVQAMVERFGTDPRRLIAAVGPSLGPCCAEFVHYRREIPADLWRHMRPGHRFDFWAVTREQLIRAGVSAARIACSRLCTRCRTDRFFSYRGEKRTGRFAAVIGMPGRGPSPIPRKAFP